jgi:hypothetical protein
MDDRDRFLEELTLLTLKYGMSLWSCGCCGAIAVNPGARQGKYVADRPASKAAHFSQLINMEWKEGTERPHG